MRMEIIDQGQQDISVVKERGQLMERGNMTVLTFSEQHEEDTVIDSMITIQADKVTVKRTGSISMVQRFIADQPTENVYRHAYGTMHMTTKTNQIYFRRPQKQEAGVLSIDYQTSLNGEEPRQHNLTISLNYRT
nr:DUF1934 domain-containing protein [Gracilibacillus alcaliphilus]